MTRHNRRPRPDLELHVVMDGHVVIGPVQATLLEAIRGTGSMAAAQRRIGASYAHIWKLVAAMNQAFSPPLVEPVRGGARGGGATLTEQGHKKTEGHAELLVISRAASHAVVKQQ